MSMIDRVRNICLTPKTEWAVIAAETSTTSELLTGYVLPLAVIGAIAGFISGSLIGHSIPFLGGTYRTPMLMGAGLAVFTLVMAVVGVFVMSLIIDALAPSFGGQKNSGQALKVAVYAYTPAWIGAVFNILPWFGGLLALLISLYGLYLLYTGLPALMKNPEDKSLGYTIVVIICAIVIAVVIGVVSGLIFGAGHLATGAMSGIGNPSLSPGAVTFDKDSPMGKLESLGKKMEQSSKAMEAAQKSGDKNAQADAAAAVLGTLLGGGRKVDPLPLDQLKLFVPESFAGFAKKSSRSETTGIAGLMVAKAAATYGGDSGKSVSLDISDSGGASGLMGLASRANVQGEKEDENGTEKTQKNSGRMTHEKISKTGGSNEYSVMLGDRFIVSAKGRGVDIEQLKSAVNGLDLGKLEGMKEVGVQK